jgi:glycosyltransferase involved in cell wall biosynthesis
MKVLERMNNVAIYPAISQDGIGTYLSSLRKIKGITLIKFSGHMLGLKQLFTPLPRGYDLIHVPHFVVPLWPTKTKIICTIHDLTPILIYESRISIRRYYLFFRIWLSIKKADHLIFISLSTCNDTLRIFGKLPPYTLIPLGISDCSIRRIESDAPYEFSYFLVVGRRRYHKNTHRVIRAFASIVDKTDAKLVFVGGADSCDAYYEELIKELNISERVYFTGQVDSDSLRIHYQFALGLVYVSLYEGFGLPILEAMKYCCPVITSNIASMPEVAGNAALFINPDSESEIANAMISIALNDELRDNLRLAGKVRVQLFPESSIYEKTAALYSNVLDTI